MKREDLKKLELTDEQVDAIMSMHGKDLEKHKGSLQDLETSVESLTKQLEEANSTIEGFKSMDVDAIKQSAEEYKAKFEQAQKDAETMKFNYALNENLKRAKVRDPQDIIPHLKIDSISFDEDGKITGLDEQLQTLQSAKSYLFEPDATEDADPQIIAGTRNSGVLSDGVAQSARRAAGLVD